MPRGCTGLFSLGYIGMGIIADLVAGARSPTATKAINLLSYMLISLGGIYTYVVFFIDPGGLGQHHAG